jgi:Domain of unknown function (DUF3127)
MAEDKKEGLSLKGRVVLILPEETINKKDGSQMIKKQFVIETEEQYAKKVCFQIMSEKVNVPKIGTLCDVKFNIESREYNGRWYNQNTAWNIWEQKNSAPTQSNTPREYPQQSSQPAITSDDDENNLPF